MRGSARQHLHSVKKFTSFRSSLSDDVQSNASYSFKVFLVPKVGTQVKSSDMAIEFVRYDPTEPEEMKQYERVIALIKPKQVSVANLGGLKAGQVVERVASWLGRRFTMNSHARCWKHFIWLGATAHLPSNATIGIVTSMFYIKTMYIQTLGSISSSKNLAMPPRTQSL